MIKLYVVFEVLGVWCVTRLAYFHNSRDEHQHNAKSGLFIQIV